MRKYRKVAAAVAALGLAATAGYVGRGAEPRRDLVVTPTMPCASDEVYVWIDYEAGDAGCVRNTDHAAHAGHE